MSTSFSRLPKTFQLFVRLEMKARELPCELRDDSVVDFDSARYQQVRRRVLNGQRGHSLVIGVVIEEYSRPPQLVLGEKGQSFMREMEDWDKVYFPTGK